MGILGAKHGLRTRGTQNIRVQLEGQWVEFNYLVNNCDALLSMAAVAGQLKFAEKYKKEVKKNIRNGGKKFHYPKVSGKYKAFKQRHGGGSTTLNWSDTMADSVDTVNLGIGKVGVGIVKGKKRPFYEGESARGNRLQVHEYANILEHGAFPVPPRPVFSDTFKSETLGGLAGLRETIEMTIIKKFGSKGIPVNKI